MDFPEQKTVVLTLGLVLLLYVLLLPIWLRAKAPYSQSVATVSSVFLPALGVEGSVQAKGSRSVLMHYVLRDPQSGGWGLVRQRLLNVPDVPLALAAAGGLMFLGWRRRLLVTLAAGVTLFLGHVALVCWTALRLSRILNGPRLLPPELDVELHRAAERIGAYRDVSSVAVLVLVAALALLIAPRSRALT